MKDDTEINNNNNNNSNNNNNNNNNTDSTFQSLSVIVSFII